MTCSTSEVSDAKRQCPERAVRRGVAVAADDRDARTSKPELGTDHVHDPLPPGAGFVKRHVERGAVVAERVELGLGEHVGDRPTVRRDVVIHRCDRSVGASKWTVGQPEPFKCLRRGDLVQQVKVDVDEHRLARFFADDVAFPHTVE